MNPQGVRVTSFKQPSSLELAHDFLWRCSLALPGARRDRDLQPLALRGGARRARASRVPRRPGDRPAPRRARALLEGSGYEDIAAWERHLARCGTRVVKFFLNVSRDEQRERFLSRAEEDEKHWKFSAADVAERAHWDAYQAGLRGRRCATRARRTRRGT